MIGVTDVRERPTPSRHGLDPVAPDGGTEPLAKRDSGGCDAGQHKTSSQTVQQLLPPRACREAGANADAESPQRNVARRQDRIVAVVNLTHCPLNQRDRSNAEQQRRNPRPDHQAAALKGCRPEQAESEPRHSLLAKGGPRKVAPGEQPCEAEAQEAEDQP